MIFSIIKKMNLEDNYFKIQKKIYETLPFIRKVFKYKWKILTNKDWEEELTGNYFINSIYGEEIYKSTKDIQKNMLKKGNTEQWDISILNIILKSKYFYDKDFQLETNKIIKIRNNISHKSNLIVPDNEFNEYNYQINSYIKYISDYLYKVNININNFNKNENTNILIEINKFKELGNNEFKNKNFIKALKYYSDGISLKCLDNDIKFDLYLNRSLIYIKLNRNFNDQINSLIDAKKAKEINPFKDKVYYRIGCSYEILYEFDKSIKNFKKGLKISSNNKEIINKISEVENKNKDYKNIDYLIKDVFNNIIPINKDIIVNYGFINCKNIYEKQMLFGLYIGLIKHIGTNKKQLYESFINDKLDELIIKEFSINPPEQRGSYYEWFLKNKNIVKKNYNKKYIKYNELNIVIDINNGIFLKYILPNNKYFSSKYPSGVFGEDLINYAINNLKIEWFMDFIKYYNIEYVILDFFVNGEKSSDKNLSTQKIYIIEFIEIIKIAKIDAKSGNIIKNMVEKQSITFVAACFQWLNKPTPN